MNRRDFHHWGLTAGLYAAGITKVMAKSTAPELGRDPWFDDFETALSSHPELLGFQGLEQVNENPQPLRLLHGQVPAALSGTLWRNGPGQHTFQQQRYHHFFDGDGLVQAFRFDRGAVSHQCRFVQTQKRQQEQAARRWLYDGFGTDIPHARAVKQSDDLNVANISMLAFNGDLLALWEGGSAHRMDPHTLETLGVKTWRPDLKSVPFGAHPRRDVNGTLWNIGYVPYQKALVLYRISANGKVVDTSVIATPHAPMVHDFMLTEHHVVLVLPPLHFEPAGTSSAFLDQWVWHPERPTRIVVLSKDTLAVTHNIEAPAFWVFHFANAYEAHSGLIRFDAPIHDSPSVMTKTFKDIMRGASPDFKNGRSNLTSFQLDLSKRRLDMSAMDLNPCEFPRIDERRTTRSHASTWLTGMALDQTSPWWFDRVLHVDHAQQRIQHFIYPDNELAEEHLFVPHPTRADEASGWVIGTTLDFKNKTSHLNIFHPLHVSDGPIAKLALGRVMPLGLHGHFVAS